MALLERINEIVWGAPMLILMLAAGGWFSIRTGFFQIRHFGLCLKETVFSALKKRGKPAERGSVSALQALRCEQPKQGDDLSVSALQALRCERGGQVEHHSVSALQALRCEQPKQGDDLSVSALQATRCEQPKQGDDLSVSALQALRCERGGQVELHSVSAMQAMCSALAATLGTGNIAGVAAALAAGGAGAVFWMWVSAVFGMMTGYAENVLGVLYRKRDKSGEWQGGAMRYIQDGLSEKRLLKPLAKPLAVLFAALCVLAAFGMGNLAQMNSAAQALSSGFGIPPLAVGIVGAVCAAVVIFGGVKRIGSFTEKLVPLMSGFYIFGSLWIIIANAPLLPSVFAEMLRGAFGIKAVGGGVCGYAVKKAVSMGFRRGIFSNEAGLGTSVAAHTASAEKEPAVQGMWSIFEVFFDTIVMCSLTAFVLLCSPCRALPLDEALLAVSLEPQYVRIAEGGAINEGVPFPKPQTGNGRVCLTEYGGEFSLTLGEGGVTYSNIALLRGIQSRGSGGELLWLDEQRTRPLIEAVEITPVNGSALAAYAFSQTFGGAAGKLLAAAIALFAFSTVVGWSSFGSQAAVFLFGKRAAKPFRVLFTAFAVVGACAELSLAWEVSDILNGLMAVPNLFAVFCLSGKVIAATDNYLARRIKKADIPPVLTAEDIRKGAASSDTLHAKGTFPKEM